MKLKFETIVNKNFLEIKNGFNRELFLFLKPPGVSVELERFDGCSPGNEVHLLLNTVGLKQNWRSLITAESQTEKEWSFIDEGKLLPWPLSTWKHHHRVVFLDDQSSKIIDDITYGCSPSLMGPLMYPVLWASFAVRPAKYKEFFEGR